MSMGKTLMKNWINFYFQHNAETLINIALFIFIFLPSDQFIVLLLPNLFLKKNRIEIASVVFEKDISKFYM